VTTLDPRQLPQDEDWRKRLLRRIRTEPLFDAPASLASLRNRLTRKPESIFMGVGLCARDELSRAVPLDLLGMLLPAEILRKTVEARSVVVLIADAHALENGFDPQEVEARAAAVEAAVARARAACRLEHLEVLRASSFHPLASYRATLERMRARAHRSTHGYILRQFADLAFLDREVGPLLKVGWALRGSDPFRQRDERVWDRGLRAAGEAVDFVYCKPGRTLADDAPRMPPYVVKRPEMRLCIDRPEDPLAKLERAMAEASRDTVSGFRRHLKRLVYTWSREVRPLPNGPIEERVAVILRQLTPARPEPVEGPELH
jgi:hypothetical protein